jgi:hypothetical protein
LFLHIDEDIIEEEMIIMMMIIIPHIVYYYIYVHFQRYGAGIFYLLAFACSVPVTNAHSEEACLHNIIPWHKIQHYGFHEDFHALLFIADLFAVAMGIKLLLDPSIDQNPSFLSF